MSANPRRPNAPLPRAGVLLLAAALAGCGSGAPEGDSREPTLVEESGTQAHQDAQSARLRLEWGEAETASLVRTVRATAVVEYPESDMFWVSPKVSGWVERLHASFEGMPVRAGEPILEIYSPELVSAQEELLLARRLGEQLAAGRTSASGDDLLAAARRRLSFWDIDEAQIDRILATGEVRKTLTLRAPRTGVVMRREVAEGQAVRAGENLLMIAPTDPVWIRAAVFERDIPFVREGQPVRVRIQGMTDRKVEGTVSFVYPELRETTRSLSVRVELPNPDGSIRPGMYAVVELESRTEPVLSLPRSAVLHTGRREIVFADAGDGRLLPLTVRTGREGDERVELLEGLEAGRRVALSALYLLDSEANLMEAMRAMMAEMGGAMDMDAMDMDAEMPGMDMEAGGDETRDGAPMEGMEMPDPAGRP